MGIWGCRYLMDHLWDKKKSNYFFKVIWTFNLAACPASQQRVRIPTALHPHPQCCNTYSIFVNLDISVGFFSAFVIVCLEWGDTWRPPMSFVSKRGLKLCGFADLTCSAVNGSLGTLTKSAKTGMPFIHFLSWKIIQKLLGISSTCKGQLQFYL